MTYAVLWEHGDTRLWWATLEDAILINAGRFLDGLQPAGIIKLCETAEDAARHAKNMKPINAGAE
jgi:hypothetical protein